MVSSHPPVPTPPIPEDYSTPCAPTHSSPQLNTSHPSQPPYDIAIPGPNPTRERLPATRTSKSPLAEAGIPRANFAPSTEHPHGSATPPRDGSASWRAQHPTKTVLQQHCAYWDADGDGVVWPSDTFRGLRAWGWSWPLAVFATACISSLSYATVEGALPDPFFRIYLARIHRAHHGSSSGSYDETGRFRPQAFEDVWAKYDGDAKGGLTLREVGAMLTEQRLTLDVFGWVATALEWGASYLLVWPADGVLRKEEMRRVFDGSYFGERARAVALAEGEARVEGEREGVAAERDGAVVEGEGVERKVEKPKKGQRTREVKFAREMGHETLHEAKGKWD